MVMGMATRTIYRRLEGTDPDAPQDEIDDQSSGANAEGAKP
jgi:hypothetical protein